MFKLVAGLDRIGSWGPVAKTAVWARCVVMFSPAFYKHPGFQEGIEKFTVEKTRMVDLNEPTASVDFLGFTFRYDRDLHGGTYRFEENASTCSGQAPGIDRQSPLLHADYGHDCGNQRLAAKLGELFSPWLFAGRVSARESVY